MYVFLSLEESMSRCNKKAEGHPGPRQLQSEGLGGLAVHLTRVLLSDDLDPQSTLHDVKGRIKFDCLHNFHVLRASLSDGMAIPHEIGLRPF